MKLLIWEYVLTQMHLVLKYIAFTAYLCFPDLVPSRCQNLSLPHPVQATLKVNEPQHEIYNNVVCATSKASDQPVHMHSLIRAFEVAMSVKLLTEHHLESLSTKGSGTGSSEPILVKMPHCWKSHVTAEIVLT